MTRVPQPGGDSGSWGNILNDYLAVAHDTDGTLRNTGVLAAKLNTADLDTQAASKITTNGTAVQTALSSTFGSVVYAVGAGIDPAGVANSTAAIQAKLTALTNAGGGVLYFPPGTFKITAKLTMGNGVSLIGSGRATSIIKGALTTALLSSPNTATRYYQWHVGSLGFDNTARGTAGGVGIDWTNISHGSITDVAINEVETGFKISEAAYYNQFDSLGVSGAVTCLVIGNGTITTNENLFNNLRLNDFTDGIKIDNSTNVTFVKPALETFTGTGIDIANTSATQYVNLFAPRFENSGGVGAGIRFRALSQASLWVGGMTASLATVFVDSTAANMGQVRIIRPGVPDLETTTNGVMLYDTGGSRRAKLYANSSTYFFRNNADSGYLGCDMGALTVRGLLAFGTDNSFDIGQTATVRPRTIYAGTSVITPGLVLGYVAKTVAYTLTAADYTVNGDATTAAFALTLPTSVGRAGQVYVLRKSDASANAVTVTTTSAQTINGASTYPLTAQYQSVRLQSDGANWMVV